MQMDGFIFGRGPDGRCDDFRVGGAIVDHDAESGLWRMWYYCRDRAFNPIAPGTLGSGRIALATSADGLDWTRVDGSAGKGAVFGPSEAAEDFDSVHVGLTDVTRSGVDWLMWYFGGDAEPRESQTPLGTVRGLGMRAGLAHSSDGLNWRRLRGPGPGGALFDFQPDQLYAAWPNVFHDGRLHRMQYTAPSLDLKDFRTLTATSEDGLHWDQSGPLVWTDGVKPWDCGGIVTRQVLANPLPGGPAWLMVYTATNAQHARSIAAATSPDGVRWTHLYGEPIFHVGPEGAWDDHGVAATRLVAVGGVLHLYYYGFQSLADDDRPRGIGLATTDSGDLRQLTRIPR